VEVALVGVDAAVADESEEVDPSARPVDVPERGVDGVVLAEVVGRDGVLDAGVGLFDDPSGTDREMADLAVAHLSLGETDRPAVSGERAGRAGVAVAVERRRAGGPDGVPSRLIVAGQPPAVQDDQRGVHGRGSRRRPNYPSFAAKRVSGCRQTRRHCRVGSGGSRSPWRPARPAGFLSVRVHPAV